jgi:rod shape-determining protein MreD
MSTWSTTNFNQFRFRFRRDAVRRLWQSLPFLTILLLLLPETLPRYGGTMEEVLPPLALMAMVYWCLHQPARLGYGAAFAAGLLQDFIMGSPPGLDAVLWLLARYVLLKERKRMREQGFVAEWIFLALLLLAVQFLHWLALGFIGAIWYPLTPTGMQWIEGVLLYPALHAALHGIERAMSRKYWYL